MPVVQSGGSEVSTSVLQLQYYREVREIRTRVVTGVMCDSRVRGPALR